MATYTSHYNLKKPATSDKIRIADFNGNADTIDSTMYDNATLGAQLKADIGIVENTNTATHNISAGKYVIWKGDLYTASSAISSGATLSNANLTAVSGGGLNALNSNIAKKVEGKTFAITSSEPKTFTMTNNSRITLLCSSAYTTHCGIINLSCSSTGTAEYYVLVGATGLTLTASGASVTISTTYGVNGTAIIHAGSTI